MWNPNPYTGYTYMCADKCAINGVSFDIFTVPFSAHYCWLFLYAPQWHRCSGASLSQQQADVSQTVLPVCWVSTFGIQTFIPSLSPTIDTDVIVFFLITLGS